MSKITEECIKGIEEIAKTQIEAEDEKGAIESIDVVMGIIGLARKEEIK